MSGITVCESVVIVQRIVFQVREEEMGELDKHLEEHCVLPVAGGVENSFGKVNIMLQAYISRTHMDNFSLVSDQAYVAQVNQALFRYKLPELPVLLGIAFQMGVEQRQLSNTIVNTQRF